MMSSTLMPLPLGDPFHTQRSIHTWVNERKSITDEDDLSYMSKVLNTPWDFNLQVPREIPRLSSQFQLQADLAELAKGTIAMFRPRWMRSAPKVAWPHRPTSFDPLADKNGEPTSPDSVTVANVPIVAPVPVVPTGPALRAHFVTKAYFAPLSVDKAAFVESFQHLPPNENNHNSGMENQALVDAVADDDDVIVYMTPDVTAAHSPGHGEDLGHEETTNENGPPAARFVDENENTARAPAIPAPNLRGPRQPFGVLYYDVESAPSHGRSPSIEEEVPYPVLHETATRVSVTAPRGWARLRPLAPSPINIEDVKRKMNLRHQNYVAEAGYIWHFPSAMGG